MMATYFERAQAYARRVIAGEEIAGALERLACQRFERDLERQDTDDFPYVIDEKKGSRACYFMDLLPHIKGEWAKPVYVDGKLSYAKLQLEDWQIFGEFQLFGWVHRVTRLRRFRRSYEEIGRKNAKALALDTPIPTPVGMRKMGEIVEGDYVFGSDGQRVRVTCASEVMEHKACYRVKFSDGSSVVAAADHLWTTRHRSRRATHSGKDRIGTVTTAQIAATLLVPRLDGVREHNHKLALAAALQTPEIALAVPPYVLGAWLGNGHAADGRITEANWDAGEVSSFIARDMGQALRVRLLNESNITTLAVTRQATGDRSLRTMLRELGVLNNKHIPEHYLMAGVEQRWALLQGLMDTDGSVWRGRGQSPAKCEFVNTNHQIAHGVWRLVRSLGIKASLIEGQAKLDGRLIGPSWKVAFNATHRQPVFRLARKRDLLPVALGKRSQTLCITACEPVETVPVRCITVDARDHLFLCGEGCVPTHNSTRGAARQLYMLAADNEPGAHCYSAATTGDQAREVFDVARHMALREPGFLARFGVSVGKHDITIAETASSFKPLNAEGSTLDGLNVHSGLVDEVHAHKTRAVWDVLDSATGARSQPLLSAITTAGSDISGICYELRRYTIQVLNGVVVDETWFGMIYTIDDGDDWRDPAIWRKANPNLGVSVKLDDMQAACKRAMAVSSAQANFLTKRLNVWISSDAPWMDMIAWERCADRALREDAVSHLPCWIPLDLASKVDVAAAPKLFYDQAADHYYLITRFYLPERAIELGRNSQYDGWRRSGHLTVTDGEVIDFNVIQDDLRADIGNLQVQEIPYDPWQATQLATNLLGEGAPMVEYRPTVASMSEPMKTFEALVLKRKLTHDGNPMMSWMVSNVVCHRDNKDNIYPRKQKDELKIDGPVAVIMGIGRVLAAMGQRENLDDFLANPVIV